MWVLRLLSLRMHCLSGGCCPAVAERALSRREHPGWLVVCADAEDASVVRMLDFPLECGALLATCLPTLWENVDWMDSIELDRSAPAPLEREWSPVRGDSSPYMRLATEVSRRGLR